MITNDNTVTQRAEIWVLLATILASSMAFIDSSALNVAVPALQADLGIDARQLFWVVNIYALFLAALILLSGSLGDHYGRKRIFTIGIIVFSAASLLCGLAPTADLLILARALQGIGGAFMVPGSLAILSATFPPERRGTAIGTWSTFSTMTTLFGPAVGGWLAGHGLWRMVFFINLPIAAIALFALIQVPESKDEAASAQLDYGGALLATLGLAGITYGFLEAPEAGLGTPRILLALIGGLIALITFVIVEARSSHPLVPLWLFKSRTFSGTNALTLFLYAALGGCLFFFPLNLVQVQGYSQEIAGLVFLPFGILLTFMSRWAGQLVDRVGARLPLIIGPTIAGLGFFLFGLPGLTGGASAYWITYFPAIIVLGVGMGITVAPLTTAVMGSAPPTMTGTASGINNAVARTAGVLAIAILGAIALSSFSQALGFHTLNFGLSESAQAALNAEAGNLAATSTPIVTSTDLITSLRTTTQQIFITPFLVKLAFIETFRTIMFIGAGLAWFSALFAALFVEGKTKVNNDG